MTNPAFAYFTASLDGRMPIRAKQISSVLTAGFLAVTLASLLSCDTELFRRTPRKSQPASVMQMIGPNKVSVTYNRPTARGRTLFGGIVRYGDTWNPGADEATAIEFSRDVLFGGQPLAAGKYSVWVTPNSPPAEWTFILSKAANVPHTPYPEGRDALRLQLRPASAPHVEALAIYFPAVDSASAVLRLHWGETMVEIPIANTAGR